MIYGLKKQSRLTQQRKKEFFPTMNGGETDSMALQALLQQIRSNKSSSNLKAESTAASSNISTANHIAIPSLESGRVPPHNLFQLNHGVAFFPTPSTYSSTHVAALQAATAVAVSARMQNNLSTALSVAPTGASSQDPSGLAAYHNGLFPAHPNQLSCASGSKGKTTEVVSPLSEECNTKNSLTRCHRSALGQSQQLFKGGGSSLCNSSELKKTTSAPSEDATTSGIENKNIKNNDNVKTGAEPAVERTIRKDEVEAALRSKPQRGRKRDNLNHLERLELTRSRNREHARSTRIRKKQRYQELLDCEEKLLETQRVEELSSKRTRCVVGFVRARETMLRNLLDKDSSLPSSACVSSGNDESTTPIEASTKGETGHRFDIDPEENHQEPEKAHPQKAPRFVSFDDLYDQGRTVDEKFPVALEVLVDDNTKFEFDVAGHHVDQMELSGFSAVYKMHSFDAKVSGCVYRSYGLKDVHGVRYDIIGLENGIAINEDGTAFVKVDLTVDLSDLKMGRNEVNRAIKSNEESNETDVTNSDSVTILSAIVSLQFATESDKLCSVEFCIAKNQINTLGLTSPQEAFNVGAAHHISRTHSQRRFFSGTDDAAPVRF